MKRNERNRDSHYKNLTRYTRDRTSFQGWRVCISRQGAMFTHYISDRSYNSPKDAEIAAISLRDEILDAVRTRPAKEVMDEYRAKLQRRVFSRKRIVLQSSQQPNEGKE